MIDDSAFRSLLGRFTSGVTVITARDAEGADHGMTVSAFSSVSLSPPLVLACIDRQTAMCEVLARAELFGVSILSEGQESISRRFAEEDEGTRFDGLAYTRGETGVALLGGALATMECRILERRAAGDHVAVIAEVLHGSVESGRPLLYYRGGYTQLEP